MSGSGRVLFDFDRPTYLKIKKFLLSDRQNGRGCSFLEVRNKI